MRASPAAPEVPLSDLVSLCGRVAVVTGGARGIGEAACRRLAEAGATVVVADVDADAAARTAAAMGGAATPLALDVRDGDAVADAVDAVVATHRRLDVWVNNAGIYPVDPLPQLTAERWDAVLDVNLRGAVLCAREAARAMVAASNGGVIVNVASTAAFRADAGGAAHYVASKFGLRGLTQALAVELGPAGIRVLGVAPTVTLTPGLERGREALEGAGFELDELAARLPLGRVAVPDDVARVILFCAVGLSGLMTGATLPVDAGELT